MPGKPPSPKKHTSRKQTSLLSALVIGLTSLVVYAFWRVQRYIRRVFKQPSFRAHHILINAANDNDMGNHGYEIAVNNLRAGIEVRHLSDGTQKLVLCAGQRNFREPWARDFGFATACWPLRNTMLCAIVWNFSSISSKSPANSR